MRVTMSTSLLIPLSQNPTVAGDAVAVGAAGMPVAEILDLSGCDFR